MTVRARRVPVKPYSLVDATSARARLTELRAGGASYAEVAHATGISQSSLHKLLNQDQARISRENRDLILACRPACSAPGRPVSAVGTQRRLQALAADGWTASEISRRTNVSLSNLHLVRSGSLAQVRGSTRDRVAKFFATASPAQVPHGIARWRALADARRNEWPRPAAWEGVDIDDPDATPPVATNPHSGVDLDEWLHLVRSGEDQERAAARLGVQPKTIESTAHRQRRHDVVDLISEQRLILKPLRRAS